MQPLGQALGRLHAEAVDEQLLGELAVGLELCHQVGDLQPTVTACTAITSSSAGGEPFAEGSPAASTAGR